MTIRGRGFWLYMMFLALLSLGFELRNEFIVMDIGESSFSVQWPKGDTSLWISSGRFDWRVWPSKHLEVR